MTQVQQISIKDINVFTTASGEVAFHNNKYMTPKTIDIMTTFLNEYVKGNSGLATVMFRTDGHPCRENQEVAWMFFPDSRAAVCNIKNCIDIAIKEATNEDIEDSECLSVWASTWLNIIMNFFHEVHHAQAFDTDHERLEDPEERKIEEDLAREYANEMVELVAQRYEQGVEPEFTTEINDMIGKHVLAKAEEIKAKETITKKERRWIEYSEYMDEHKLVYYAGSELTADGVPISMSTLKEYLHVTSGAEVDDPDWNRTPNKPVVTEVVDTVPANTTIIPPTVQLRIPEDDEPYDEFGPVGGPLPFEPDTPIQTEEDISIAEVLTKAPIPQSIAPQAAAPVTNAPTAPAANTPVIGEKLYENLGWDVARVQAVIKSVYGKIAHHIFSTCGFNPSMNPFFAQREKIAEFIPLTPDELCIVKHMDCYNESGQFRQNVEVTHGISGIYIDKAQTLVGYTLSMNTGNGNQMRRKFVPQNPWKKKDDGNYSATALQAQQGNQILWILDPDATNKSLCARVRNNVLESNASGKWCAA